jgi:hypothetical protein
MYDIEVEVRGVGEGMSRTALVVEGKVGGGGDIRCGTAMAKVWPPLHTNEDNI